MADKLAYTIDEVVAATNTCRDKIYDEIRSGHLRATKWGRRTLIQRDDLMTFLGSLEELRLEPRGTSLDVAKSAR